MPSHSAKEILVSIVLFLLSFSLLFLARLSPFAFLRWILIVILVVISFFQSEKSTEFQNNYITHLFRESHADRFHEPISIGFFLGLSRHLYSFGYFIVIMGWILLIVFQYYTYGVWILIIGGLLNICGNFSFGQAISHTKTFIDTQKDKEEPSS